MIKILAFYDTPFGCYAADRQTDGQTGRIPKFNTSLIGRGKHIVIYANLKNIHTYILYISNIELGKNIKVKKLSHIESQLLDCIISRTLNFISFSFSNTNLDFLLQFSFIS
jgi:hypothetical protein